MESLNRESILVSDGDDRISFFVYVDLLSNGSHTQPAICESDEIISHFSGLSPPHFIFIYVAVLLLKHQFLLQPVSTYSWFTSYPINVERITKIRLSLPYPLTYKHTFMCFDSFFNKFIFIGSLLQSYYWNFTSCIFHFRETYDSKLMTFLK